MKTLITYYSYSGNTEKAVNLLVKLLGQRGEIAVQRLKPKDEIHAFFAQCRAAFLRKRAILEKGVIYDVAPYDLIIIASPVWAFAPTPAINTFLDKLSGAENKRFLMLLTYASGAGLERCFGAIARALEEKGASKIDKVSISDRKVGDGESIKTAFKDVL